MNPLAMRLAAAFWPGFLGMIVKKKAVIPDFVTAGMQTVLLTCLPGLGQALPVGVGGPVVASSANISKTPPALDMEDVHAFVQRAGAQIDAVIEGGISPWNRPTTIINTCVTPPTIVRRGVVDEQAIRKVCPDVEIKEW
jgi:L-threonylcarbamoyladenylate synthase